MYGKCHRKLCTHVQNIALYLTFSSRQKLRHKDEQQDEREKNENDVILSGSAFPRSPFLSS